MLLLKGPKRSKKKRKDKKLAVETAKRLSPKRTSSRNESGIADMAAEVVEAAVDVSAPIYFQWVSIFINLL